MGLWVLGLGQPQNLDGGHWGLLPPFQLDISSVQGQLFPVAPVLTLSECSGVGRRVRTASPVPECG